MEETSYSATALNSKTKREDQPSTPKVLVQECAYCGKAHDIESCFLIRKKSISNGVKLPVRVLIDNGSDQTYLRKTIADSLNLASNGPNKMMTISMHGGQSRTTKVRNVSFQLSTHDERKQLKLNAWAVATICSPLEPAPIDLAKYPHLQGLKYADTYPRKEATIDILLGADQRSKIIKGGMRKGRPNSPVAQIPSLVGYCPVPRGVERPANTRSSSSSHFATAELVEDDTNLIWKKFWDLESIGIIDDQKDLSQSEKDAVQQFQESINFDGERYEVALPWIKTETRQH